MFGLSTKEKAKRNHHDKFFILEWHHFYFFDLENPMGESKKNALTHLLHLEALGICKFFNCR